MKGHAQIQHFLLLLNTGLTLDMLQQSGSKSMAVIFCPVIAHFHEALRVVGDTTLPLQRTASHQAACASLPSQDVSAARPTNPRHVVSVTSANPQRGKKKKHKKHGIPAPRASHAAFRQLKGFAALRNTELYSVWTTWQEARPRATIRSTGSKLGQKVQVEECFAGSRADVQPRQPAPGDEPAEKCTPGNCGLWLKSHSA